MNWIEVIDKKELPYDRKLILAQDEYGNTGVVYWNSYGWVYDIPGMGDEIELPGKIVKYIILFIERQLAKRTDLIIAISEKQKYDLVYKYKIAPSNKISVVHLGFDLSKFISNSTYNKLSIKNAFNILEDEIIITIVGRLVPIKNHFLFLNIIKELKLKYNIKLKALIVGDGSERFKLEKYCKENKLSMFHESFDSNYDVYFTSWRSDIAEIYSITDYVILTSRNEGTPVSVIEGMASGKVVLSTNVGGVSDIINDNSGFICSPDVGEFVNIVLQLIENKDLYNSISINARRNVIEKFDYRVLCDKMAIQYLNLLK
jgi:glycosyltransferase involved in cell wall biosynthesis